MLEQTESQLKSLLLQNTSGLMVCQVWTSLKLNASYTIKVSKTHGIVLAIHDRPSWGSHCGNWAVTQDSTATQAFSQGFTLKKVWKISKRRGISAAWDGAQAHVKNMDGDSVGSCPLEQDRRYHRKEVWKKKILLLYGLNLSFRENRSW